VSQRRRSNGARRPEQDAHDVLAGRVAPEPGELLDLIHAINPTGRSLSVADERRRYQLKARLQSVLVRRFADDLAVAAEADGVVAIQHRYLGQDACHARIDDLDVDVRAHVRRVLDVGDVAEPEVGIPPITFGASDSGDVGPLARGRAALAEYDYEAARAYFEQALGA
jgi:hypothetical protein